MRLGLSTYALTWAIGVPGYEPPDEPLDANGLIELTSGCGLRLLQIADNIPLNTLDDSGLAIIRGTAERTGVTLELGTRGTDPAHLLRYLQLAQYFGSSLVRTLITTPDIVEAERQLREVLPAFEQAGVVLAIENHGLHTVPQLAGLLDRLDSTHAGSCLDTVNSFGALEGPATVIEGLAPYTVNLHIKDFAVERVDHMMGFTILGTPAGAGRLDIPGLLRTLRSYGRHPTCILELWTPYRGSTAATVALERKWLDDSLTYLNRLEFQTNEG